MPVALITGASRGFGRAVARELAGRGWELVLTARTPADLHRLAVELGPGHQSVEGDVADDRHRDALTRAVHRAGRLDLLLNNASALGPSPLPALADYPLAELKAVLRTNVVAPLALVQQLLSVLERSGGSVINVSSDAAVEAYEGWGGYGASKAALDQLSSVLAVERPQVSCYAFDPGDMRTDMQQAAHPGEDISDRPEPESVVPALLRLVEERPPSGRYRAADLLLEARA